MSGAISFYEGFENGSSGDAITTSNTSFNLVGGTATMTLDNTRAAFGSLSAKIVSSGGVGAFANIRYNFPASHNAVYSRCAVYITANPPDFLIINSTVSSGNFARLLINTSGTIAVRNAGTVVATSTNTVPLNQWFAVEWKVDATNTTQSARLYTGLTGSPLETITGTYTQGNPDGYIVGLAATVNATVWLDEVANSYDDWLGPFSDRPTVNWFRA